MSTRLVKCLLTLGAYTKRYEANELTHHGTTVRSHVFKSYSHTQGECAIAKTHFIIFQ